jgi:hypothetical protein
MRVHQPRSLGRGPIRLLRVSLFKDTDFTARHGPAIGKAWPQCDAGQGSV